MSISRTSPRQALMKMMMENECDHGTCIVMEVKTGKIKAIANLGRQQDGTYSEDLNYAITKSEPGSTFKLVTMLSVLEDKYVTTWINMVNLEGGVGKWPAEQCMTVKSMAARRLPSSRLLNSVPM